MQDTPRSITELKRQRGLLPPLPGSISAKKAERGIPFSPAPVSSGKWLLQKNVQDALMEPDNAMGRTMVPTAEGPQLLSGMAEQYTQELNRNVGQHGQTWPMQSSVTTLSPRPSGQEPAPSIIYDATQAYSDPGFWDQISQKSPEMAAFWKSAQEQYGKDAPTVMQELATQESQRSIEEWRKQNPKKSILEHTGSMLQFFTAAGAVKGVGTAVGKKVLSKAAQEAVAKKSGSVLGRMAAGSVIGAAADASLQGGRVATGAQDEFSLAQVGSTAVGGAAGALAGSAVQGLSKLAGRSPVAAAMIRSLRTPAEFTAFQKASEAVGDAPPGDAHLSGWEKALKLAYDSALAGGYHRVTGRSPLALPEPGQSKASQRIIEGMKGPGAATTAAPELARVKAGQYVETPTGPQKVRVVGEHTVQPERGPPIPAKDVRVVPDPTPQPSPTPKPVAAPKPKPAAKPKTTKKRSLESLTDTDLRAEQKKLGAILEKDKRAGRDPSPEVVERWSELRKEDTRRQRAGVPREGDAPKKVPAPKDPSGWEVRPADEFKQGEGSDPDYVYHVTTKARAKAIMEEGFASGKAASMSPGGTYSEYSKGKTFFGERESVSFWRDTIETHLESQRDAPKNGWGLVVIRVPRSQVPEMKPDVQGTRDSRRPSHYTESPFKRPTTAPKPAPAKQPSEAVQAVRDAISGKKKITWDEVRRLHREADESTRLKIRSAVESGSLNPTNSGRPKNRSQAVRQLANDVYPERTGSKKPTAAPKPQPAPKKATAKPKPITGGERNLLDHEMSRAIRSNPEQHKRIHELAERFRGGDREALKEIMSIRGDAGTASKPKPKPAPAKKPAPQQKKKPGRTIQLEVNTQKGQEKVAVQAEPAKDPVDEFFGVHRPVPFADGTSPKGWSITHIPTGRGAWTARSRPKAKDYLRALYAQAERAGVAAALKTKNLPPAFGEFHRRAVKFAERTRNMSQDMTTYFEKEAPKDQPKEKPLPKTEAEMKAALDEAFNANPRHFRLREGMAARDIAEIKKYTIDPDTEMLQRLADLSLLGDTKSSLALSEMARSKEVLSNRALEKSAGRNANRASQEKAVEKLPNPADMSDAALKAELEKLHLEKEYRKALFGGLAPKVRDRLIALNLEHSARKKPKSEIQKAADEIRDLRKDRPGEAGALDTDVLVAAAKRAGKALLAVMDAPRRSAGAVAGVGKQGKEVYDRQRAVQAMKHAKRWLDQKSELSEMEAQDLRLAVEAGKVKVEEVRSPDWRTVEIKLSDGRLIRTIEDNPFSTHSKVGRGRPGKPGSKRPQGLDEGILLETDMVDVLSRRLPAAIDRAIEGAIGNRGMYRGLRRLMTEQDKNPALANLTEESRLMMREAHDKLRKIQWDVNRVLEKSTEADRPAILESLTFFHENLGPLPYRMVKDRADLRTLNDAVKLMRENFALMGRVWEGTGFLKTETVEQFQDPRIRGQGPGSTYAPRKYRNKPQVDKTTRESRAAMDALGMKSLLDPWAIQRISGTFKQRTLDLEESIRSGRITDYRSAMEEMGRQLHGAEKALTFKRIADDPLLSREADPAATLRKDLASAKVKERKLRTKMGQKGILVEAERTQKDEASQSRARASWRRAHGAYEADPGKETLKALKSAETRWIKTLRVPAGQKLEAYLDGLVTRKLDHTSPSFRSMNDALADAVRERIRLEHEASSEWVEMPDSAAMGPLRGMFVRREVADAIQEPLKRVMWWQAFKSIHAHAKKQATGRNPSVHVTNFFSNRFTLEGMGVDTLLPAYNRFEWMARRILRQQSETGKWEFSKKELAHLQKLGLDPQATRDQVQRYLDSGIYSNSQYAVEIGPDNVSLAKAKERYEARAESMGSKQAAVPTIEAIDLAIQSLDMTILESTGPLGKGIKRLQDAYSRADAAQGLAGFLALASGKGNSYGRAIPEQVALERMQSFLDFSKVPRLVQGVSHVWSFARIFYMLPRGVIRAITSPSGLARMLNKPAQASRAAATVQALGSALWRVGKFVAPIVTAHQVAQTRWGLSDEEYEDRMRAMGYGRGYRSLFVLAKCWGDTVGFIDLTKYLPHAQAGVWLLEAADTIRNIAKGKDLSDEFRAATIRKNILLSPIDEMYRGRGFYDQEQGFFEGLGRAASGVITPRVVKSVAEAVDRDTLTIRQRLLYPLGIRERDISEEKALDYWMRNEAEFDPDVEAREFMTITQTKRLERLRELALERRKGPLSKQKQAEQEELEKKYREFQAKYRRKSQLSKQRRSEQD